MGKLALIVLAALVAACGSQPSGPPCRVRADRMGSTLTLLSASRPAFYAPTGVKVLDLPNGRETRELGWSMVIESDGEVSFMGRSIGTSRDRLAEELAMVRDMAGGRDERVIYVVADADLTLGALDEVLAAVPREYELRLAGYGPPIELDVYQDRLREVPSVKKVRAAIDESNPAGRATFVAEAMEEAMGTGCAELTAVFGRVALDEDKGRYIAREAPIALEKCRCNVKDADLIEYLLYAVLGAYERPHVWLPLEREHGPPTSTVASLAR